MANKTVFSNPNKAVKTVANKAGGVAVELSNKEALAKYVCTSMFNDTYYTSAEEQVKEINSLVDSISDNEFLAKCAVYARRVAGMKDTPAYLLNVLYSRDRELFKRIFPVVIDSGRMLRTFSQMARSDAFRRNLSNKTFRGVFQAWFDSKSPDFVFRNSLGNDPSLVDIVKMTHVKGNANQDVISYLMGKEYNVENLPQNLRDYLAWQKDRSLPVPEVDFKLLDSYRLTTDEWAKVLRSCSWNTLRMNLATFERHGVFNDRANLKFAADKLLEKVPKSVFPYQVYSAYLMNRNNLVLANALNEVMERSVENLPMITGKTVIAVDTSGSMSSVVGNAHSSITFVQVASMFAASVARRCKESLIVPFDTIVHDSIRNSSMSIVTLAEKLSQYGGGGTDISSVLHHLKNTNENYDNLILISDNESWTDYAWRGESFGELWNKMPGNRKLVSIDIAPNRYSNANTKRKNSMFVSGFNDSVFEAVARFFENQTKFIDLVEKTAL